MKLTKKRIVLFLLFIFPLICFLILSTGKNNFIKLPVVTKNIVDISTIDSTKTFKDHISIVCFLGNDMDTHKGGFFNLNEKIYKKFIEYNKFQNTSVYGTVAKGETNAVNLSFGNALEMKVYDKSDTTNTFKKVPLLRYLNFRTGYNFAGDTASKFQNVTYRVLTESLIIYLK